MRGSKKYSKNNKKYINKKLIKNKLRSSHPAYKCKKKGTLNLLLSRTKPIVAFIISVLIVVLLRRSPKRISEILVNLI